MGSAAHTSLDQTPSFSSIFTSSAVPPSGPSHSRSVTCQSPQPSAGDHLRGGATKACMDFVPRLAGHNFSIVASTPLDCQLTTPQSKRNLPGSHADKIPAISTQSSLLLRILGRNPCGCCFANPNRGRAHITSCGRPESDEDTIIRHQLCSQGAAIEESLIQNALQLHTCKTIGHTACHWERKRFDLGASNHP